MRLNKANFAGLTSLGQQSEMQSILAGTWPPLKPLPVFKYETDEYRATIDFDKKRGEWVCRKTSLPSNEVQELRGGLREITMALPHGETEVFTEGVEQQEPEFERETNRRLQAIRDWKEKYENGARYFELREYLSESQRAELDDSLRLSLTARQLQFNPKNVANVFDDLSIAGGRFAALIEFAKGNKRNQGIAAQAQGDGAVPEAEHASQEDKKSLETSSPELAGVLPHNEPLVPSKEAAERCSDAEGFPALSIKDVFPEKDQAPLPERMAVPRFQQFETESCEVVDADSASLVEHPDQEADTFTSFIGFAAQTQTGQSIADRVEGATPYFPAFKISAFQVNVLAILFLFAVTSFIVGLTVGRGPLGKRLREPPKSILVVDATSPKLADQTDESTPRNPASTVESSGDAAGTNKLDNVTPSEEESKDIPPYAGSAEVRPTDSDSSPTIESKPAVKTDVNSEPSGEMAPVVRNLPPASSKPAHPRKAVQPTSSAPRIPAPNRLTTTIGVGPHPPRSSVMLFALPRGGNQPFKVSFPEKAVAATSSLAMASRLSVLVSPEPGPTLAHKSARLEAGELVSFTWPHYPTPEYRYGSAQTIRVRAIVGQLGQVLEVKFLSGSVSLFPATVRALRQWRYRPTLLDKRPVQAQQDVTIEFRPPQYSTQLRTQHPSHN